MNDGQENRETFKSTEIYKTQAKTGEDFFNKNKDKSKNKKSKSLGVWIKNHKLIFAAIILLIIVLILIIFLIILMLNNQNPSDQTTSEKTETSEDGSASSADLTDENVNYQEITDNEDLSAIVQFYDEKIAAADSDEAKADFYLQRAADLYAHYDESVSGLADQIIADSLKAEELIRTAETAYLIYMYKSALGQDGAEEYLDLAKERDSSYGAEGNG